jgi:hypothetical protein
VASQKQTTVAVEGIKAFARDVKKGGEPPSGELLKAMRLAGRNAAKPVAAALKERYPQLSGALSRSVRVTASPSGAAVRAGYSRDRVPYAGPVDFGGYPGERRWYSNGRYLYPTAQALLPGTSELYSMELQKIFERFHWTNGASTPPEVIHD